MAKLMRPYPSALVILQIALRGKDSYWKLDAALVELTYVTYTRGASVRIIRPDDVVFGSDPIHPVLCHLYRHSISTFGSTRSYSNPPCSLIPPCFSIFRRLSLFLYSSKHGSLAFIRNTSLPEFSTAPYGYPYKVSFWGSVAIGFLILLGNQLPLIPRTTYYAHDLK